LIRRVLQRVGSGPSQRIRPRNVIIWLDDLQWGQDALAFADYLIRHPELSPAPILVVGTVQLGAIEERKEEAALLHMLREQAHTQTIRIDPLGSGHHRELIKSLLGNEGQLVERVARRTAGNPLFAVQLVGDWVERGVLLTGPGGVLLKPGVTVELPDNLHAIWDSRIERFLGRHEGKAGRALEVAATLGDKVDRREWRAAAEKLGVRPSPALVAGLIRHRLVMADPEGEGWSFSHPMLRECLERRARNSRRASRVHLACARMLQERVGSRPGSAERIGTHLLRGGEAMEALVYFLRAADERYSQGAFHQVSALLNDWEQAMVEEGMPASEPMWGRGWLLRGRVQRALGNLDEALQVIARAMRVAEEQGWPDVVAACLCEEGVVLQRMGDWERGWRRLRKAESQAQKLGDETLMATVLNWQGDLLVNQGRLDEATAVFEKFRQISARIGNQEQEADSYFQLGRVDKQAGRLELAQTRLVQSLELFESVGARWGIAKSVNELGEVARLENRLTQAATHYRQALEKMEELGLPEATVPRLNLALVMMQQGDYRGAQPLVEHAHELFGRSSSASRRGITHLMLLICSIAQDHWADWDHHLTQAQMLFAASGFVDIDVAMCATAAGDMACEGGYLVRARSAWDLATDQWLGLDRPAEAEQIRLRIKTGKLPGTAEA
jgi:tetratricopeptide (TPR) repeat protein